MPAKPRLGPAEAPAPLVPSDARLARRDRSASAVATRVCVLHPVATTAPDPHLQDASGRRPSWIETRALSVRNFGRGLLFFRKVIPDGATARAFAIPGPVW